MKGHGGMRSQRGSLAVCFAALGLCATLHAQPAATGRTRATEPPIPPAKTYRTTDPEGRINIRSKPDLQASIVDSLPAGICLVGEPEGNRWMAISTIYQERSLSGFIHASRLVADSICWSSHYPLKEATCDLAQAALFRLPNLERFQAWYAKSYAPRPRCDDGEYAEGLSQWVVSTLAERWPSSLAVVLSPRLGDPAFGLLCRHLDATVDQRDLERIVESSRGPDCLSKPRCQAIHVAAVQALREMVEDEKLQRSKSLRAPPAR